MTSIVRGVKRSTTYRRVRSHLIVRCPVDVWTDDKLGFVQFEVDGEPARSRPAWLVFVVHRESGRLVAAKSVEPDQTGQNVIAWDLMADHQCG